jgi:Ala-tRNA(Pro) deacylase
MPVRHDRTSLLEFLQSINVRHETVDHPPIFTVDEGRNLKLSIPGAHTKNLFLKDKKGALWLICAEAETRVDLNAAAKALGAARFSFGAPALLEEALGVSPGSVTLFAVINDPDHRVRLVLDAALVEAERVNFHPLTNAATTGIDQAGLARFLAAMGRRPALLVLSVDPPLAVPAPD